MSRRARQPAAPPDLAALGEGFEGKRFYKVGEAAKLVGVKPHVLRYWEDEIPELEPLKTRGAHRMYTVADLELACRIRDLVQGEGLTVAGARRRLRARGAKTDARDAVRQGRAHEDLASRRALLAVRAALVELLDAVEAPPPPRTTTVVRIEAIGPAPRRPR